MAETKNVKVNVTGSKPVFSWKSPEFLSQKRDKKQILGVILIALIFAVILFFQKQWTGTGLVVVAALILLLLSNTKPKEVGCAVYNEGLVADGKVYGFDQFKSFWLVFGDIAKIRLQLTGRFGGQVTLPLGENDPEQIRLFLSKKLPEDENKNEDINDVINRLIRF